MSLHTLYTHELLSLFFLCPRGPKFFQDFSLSKCAVHGLQIRPTLAGSSFYTSSFVDASFGVLQFRFARCSPRGLILTIFITRISGTPIVRPLTFASKQTHTLVESRIVTVDQEIRF